MRIWIKGKPVRLIPGMTVRQALIRSDLLKEIGKGTRIFDEWGNEMGLDGALEEGMRLELRLPEETNRRDPLSLKRGKELKNEDYEGE